MSDKQVKREELVENTSYVLECPYCNEFTEVHDVTEIWTKCEHCMEGIKIVD